VETFHCKLQDEGCVIGQLSKRFASKRRKRYQTFNVFSTALKSLACACSSSTILSNGDIALLCIAEGYSEVKVKVLWTGFIAAGCGQAVVQKHTLYCPHVGQ
jgi:trans-2-enoyl-CoA reductase